MPTTTMNIAPRIMSWENVPMPMSVMMLFRMPMMSEPPSTPRMRAAAAGEGHAADDDGRHRLEVVAGAVVPGTDAGQRRHRQPADRGREGGEDEGQR